jgi:iron complex outermembrane receptor protein
MGVATAQSQYRIMSGSNPNLEPTTSKNWSIGFDWIPTGALDGFRASLDYWSISEEDIVNGLPEGDVLQSVEALGADSPYAQYVRIAESVAGELHFHDGAPITAPGQITSANSDAVWFTSSLTNIAGIDQEGIDLRLSYSYDTESWGTFSGALAGTYLLKYDQQLLPTDPVVDLSGVYNDDYGNFPKYRAFLQLGWKYGPWVAGINGTYIPSVEDVTYGKDENGRNYSPDVDSYMSWDVRVGYNFGETSSFAKGLAVTFGINNVFDEQPPYVDSEANQSRDIGTYDPIGTLYYAEVSYKF